MNARIYKDLLKSVRFAYQRYSAFLDEKKKAEEKAEEVGKRSHRMLRLLRLVKGKMREEVRLD